MFAPETWGEIDRFIHFYGHTYTFNARDRRAVGGVRNHIQKALTLINLAKKLRPNLQIDIDQLEQHGFTPAANAQEVSTVVEAAILEIYATLDCTVKLLRAVYGPTSPGFKESTRKVFASPTSIGGSFPEELKTAILEARWYKRLLHLRDELTHLGTGRVTADRAGGTVRYDHYGIKEGDTPMSIGDIYAWLDLTLGQVNALTGLVFRTLNQTLADIESFETCGMVDGRALWRYVSPVGDVTFNSGKCGAWIWFEKPGEPRCPFIPMCGAYLNKAPPPAGDPPTLLESDILVPEPFGDEQTAETIATDGVETSDDKTIGEPVERAELPSNEKAPRQSPKDSDLPG